MKQAIESIVALGGRVEFNGYGEEHGGDEAIEVHICMSNSGVRTNGRTVEEALGAALEEISLGAHRRSKMVEEEASKLDAITDAYKQSVGESKA